MNTPSNAGPFDVLLLEDDADMVIALKDALELMTGKTCLAFTAFEELLRDADRAIHCRVAVLDINLGEGRPSGIEAYRWLKGHDFHGRVFFLTGHANTHPLVVEAGSLGEAAVVPKPVDLETLVGLIGP
ncbi:MAG: response regulator [Deltaproteobacteria bacterium]|nr:response regulator [Deltaproteobacteria bacterium]